jgi:hypothetical protein
MERSFVLGQMDGGGTIVWLTGAEPSGGAYIQEISAITRDSAGNLYVGTGAINNARDVIIQRRGSSVVPDPPVAIAVAADQIAGTSARLNGAVNPNGFTASWHFEYGPTPALGFRTSSQSLAVGGSPVPVNAVVTGLNGNTQYYFRLVATGDIGTSISGTLTFSTVLSAYQQWAASKFGSHSAPGSGPDEDFDLDGFANRFEYAFGGDPLVGGPIAGWPAPEWFFDETSGFRFLSIVWQENPAATDIRYAPEASLNLQTWTAYNPASGVITVHALSGDRRRAVARDFQPLMRLRLLPGP